MLHGELNLECEMAHCVQQDKWRSADVKTAENVEFSSLLLSERILEGLKDCGFEKPSPVQLQAIPLGRCGLDLVVQAKSGTGKTGVLAVIALDSLVVDSPNTQVLILAPTREIASQVCGVVRSLGCAFPDLTCETFIGGLPLSTDKTKLPNCQIVVGTPGRVKQLIDMELLQTDAIRLFIVDEADRLFDKQFKEDINWIFSSLPSRKQILALSATYPDELAKFLTLYMENPVFVRVNSKDPALLGITQYFHSIPYHPLPQVTDSAKFNVLLDILNSVTFSQCMIFCQKQTKAQDLADNLVLKGFPTLGICSALEQVRRLEIIHELKTFQCRVLVSTDLTARGIDAENVNLVVNFDVPYEGEVYLHRIGRAGRYGTRGMSISLASSGDEIKRMKSFQKKFLFKIYQLPDPIPADLWNLAVLEASIPGDLENVDVSAETSTSINTNDAIDSSVHGSPIHEGKQNQPLAVIPDQLESSSCGAVDCTDDGLKNNGVAVQNGCHEENSHPSSLGLVISNVIGNREDKLTNSDKITEKPPEGENNLASSIPENQDESEKHSECQRKNEVENDGNAELKMVSHNDVLGNATMVNSEVIQGNVELKMVSHNDVLGNATVVNGEVIQDKANEMCIPSKVNIAPSSSKRVADINATDGSNCCLMSNTTSVNYVDLLDNKADGSLKNTENKNQGGENLSSEHDVFSPEKSDNPENMGLEIQDNCDEGIIAASEEKALHFNSLLQKWGKHMHSNESLDFSDKEVSNILLSFLSSDKPECFKSDLSYDKLVDSLECYNQDSVNSTTEHDMGTCFPTNVSITSTQLKVLQKYISHDNSEVFHHVQKNFSEIDPDLLSEMDEASGRRHNQSTLNTASLDVLLDSNLPGDNQLMLQSASVLGSGNAMSCGTSFDPEQTEVRVSSNSSVSGHVTLHTKDQSSSEVKPSLKKHEDVSEFAKASIFRVSDTVVARPRLETGSKSSSEVKPSLKKLEDVSEFAKADIFRVSDTVAAKPRLETGSNVKESFISLRGDKSVGVAMDNSTVRNHDAKFNNKVHNLTESDYVSVSRGMKHCKIVPLPSGPCDSPKKNSLVCVKDNGPVRASNMRAKGKGQHIRKKVISEKYHNSQETEKQKLLENPVRSAECHTSELSFSDKNGTVAKDAVLSLSDQGTGTLQKSRKHFDSGHVSMPHVVEKDVGYEKQGKPKYVKYKHKHSSHNPIQNRINSVSGDQNPADVVNSGMNDHRHPDFYEPSCSSLHHQNRKYVPSNLTGTEAASSSSPNHYVHSCHANSPHFNRSALQYDCCCQLPYIYHNQCYFQPPVPFHNSCPQYYYKKYLELWYYVQELTYGYHR